MAVHTVQGRDPWWASLAVNVLGGLFNDWQQRERNKKEAAYLGELAKMYNGMQNGQNDTAAPAPEPAQDTGQGLLNMNMPVPDGYNNNGWASAFHKNNSPLLQFDLDTAGLAPTAPTAVAPATTAPLNAWADAFRNSGNAPAQFDANTAGIVPATATAQPLQAQQRRAPIVTPMDFYRAALELAGSKRFRMLSPDRVQAMLTPYMKINEEARQEQLRNAAAEDYLSQTSGAGRVNSVMSNVIRGITPESLGNTVFNQNKPTVSTVDAGGQIHFYDIDPMTGMPINTWAVDRTLTPQEIAANKLSWAQFNEGQRQFDKTMGYNYANLRQQGKLQNRELFHSTYTDADGVTWIIYNNGRTQELSTARGLTEQQKEKIKNNGTILTNIQTRREQLQKEKNAWILKNQVDEARKVDEQIKALDAEEQRILQENNSIINSGSTGQQKQTAQPVEYSTPPAGQSAPNNGNNVQQTPPTGQNAPNNTNTVQPMPPAVPPTAKDIPQDAVLVNDEGQFYTQKDIDKIIVDRNIDGAMFVDSLRGAGYVTPSEFQQSGGKFRLTDNTPRWVMPDGTKITHKQEQDLIAQVERGEHTDIKNRQELYADLRRRGATPIGIAPDMPNPRPIQRDVTPDMANGTNNTVASAGSRYVNVLGSNGNEILTSDTSTEAGIQRAMDNLNGQFGGQRWADWATAFNPQDFTNNNYSGLRNNFSLSANEIPMSNYSPNRLDSNTVLAINRRTRPQRTYSGYYSGDTLNGGQYSDIINRQARNHNVDPDLIAAIIQQESGGNSRAVSQAGAQGLMQLMPKTAQGLGVTNPLDPEQNIAGGTKYIAQMLKRYNGNIEKALWAYNAGPGNADKGTLPAETAKYIPSVMARYRKLKGIAPASHKTPKRAVRRRRARNRRRR